MKANDAVEVRLPNSLEALEPLHSAVAGFCRSRGIDPDSEFKIDLALEEVFSNIVRHGGADGRAHEVVVRIHGGRGRVCISVEDEGRPFNPLRQPEVDVGAALSERRAGGLGIHLVRQLLDEVRYQRRPQGNRLILVKRLAREEKRT